MLIRTSIVLLIVLNLGVAAWWLAGPASPSRPLPVHAENVPRLQLLHEQPGTRPEYAGGSTSAPAPGTQIAGRDEGGDTAAAAASTCFSFGPFEADAGALAAAGRLRNVAGVTTRTRSVPAIGASAYNVFLPPLPERTQAQAIAESIRAAGFDDFLVVNAGEMANSVALGRYGSLEGAQRRQASLQAAGFAAQVSAVGATQPAQWWVDARAPAAFAPQDAQLLVGAVGSQALDCGMLR